MKLLERYKKLMESDKSTYLDLRILMAKIDKELEAKDKELAELRNYQLHAQDDLAAKDSDYALLGIELNHTKRLLDSCEEVLSAKDKLIADLKERISQVNDWLNSDTIFNDYEALKGFRLLTKDDN